MAVLRACAGMCPGGYGIVTVCVYMDMAMWHNIYFEVPKIIMIHDFISPGIPPLPQYSLIC